MPLIQLIYASLEKDLQNSLKFACKLPKGRGTAFGGGGIRPQGDSIIPKFLEEKHHFYPLRRIYRIL